MKIQTKLEPMLRSPNSDAINRVSVSSNENPKYEYAFPAACKQNLCFILLFAVSLKWIFFFCAGDIPRYMNVSRWFEGKTWNIMFKPIYRRYNVIESTIRYEKDLNLKLMIKSFFLFEDFLKL